MEMDLRVIRQEQPVIEINFDEIKNNLAESVKEYSGLIVTDDTLPICKAKQKELAGIRVKIDNYRKEVKKAMSKPIDEFESKCKQLIGLVEEAEKPLKEGIQVFDDKKREEKRQIAIGIIQAAIGQHGLKPKYAEQLSVLDKYTNLTAKASEVREDVEQRVFILLGEQKKEEEMLEIIQDTIDNANKTIKAQLSMSDFQRLIDRGISPKDIIAEVNSRAEQIRKAENPPPAPESTVQQAPPQPEPVKEATKEPDAMYFVELRVTGTKLDIGNLGQYLRGNGYTYNLVKQGKVE
jgi:vacuolar-type H+-ATPase subunit I/STV1